MSSVDRSDIAISCNRGVTFRVRPGRYAIQYSLHARAGSSRFLFFRDEQVIPFEDAVGAPAWVGHVESELLNFSIRENGSRESGLEGEP